MSDANPDENPKSKRRKLLLLTALLSVPLVTLSAVGVSAAIRGNGDRASATSAAEGYEDDTPRIRAESLTNERGSDAAGTDVSQPAPDQPEAAPTPPTEGVTPVLPVSPDLVRPSAPVSDGQSPASDAGAPPSGGPAIVDNAVQPEQPAEAPRPGSPTPAPVPTEPAQPDETQPEPGPTTPAQPNEPTPVPTAAPTPSAEPEENAPGAGTPDPNEGAEPDDGFGGETEQSAARLPDAVQHMGYLVTMRVTGSFESEGAAWSLSEGALPTGLTIDPLSGAVSGVTVGEVGDYTFQITVENSELAVTGWFTINVVASTVGEPSPEPSPAPGTQPGEEPTPSPGDEPTPAPSPEPTGAPEPTPAPTSAPTPAPTSQPTPAPEPSEDPTPAPEPTTDPTPAPEPTAQPTPEPDVTGAPAPSPSDPPTSQPSPEPSDEPTPAPSAEPTPSPEETPGAGNGEDDGSTIEPGDGGTKTDVVALDGPKQVRVIVGEEVSATYTADSSLELPVRYRAENLPSWLTFVDGSLTGVAPQEPSLRTVSLIAETSGGSITVDVLVFVDNPVDVVTLAPSVVLVREFGEPIEVDSTATSKLGLEITYSAEGLPDWLAFDRARLVGTAPAAAGEYTITIRATTQYGSDERIVYLRVVAPRDSVSIDTANAFTTVTAGDPVDISITATSKLGLPVSIDAIGLPAWLRLEGNQLLGAAPNSPGSVQFVITAATTYGSARETFSVRVLEPQDTVSFDRGSQAETFVAMSSLKFELATPATSRLGLDVTYTLEGAPAWLGLEGGSVVGVAPDVATGLQWFTVTARTQYGVANKRIGVSVQQPVDVVTFDRGNAAERFAVPTGALFELDVPATSQLDLEVAYSLSGAVPSWISLDGSRLVGTAPASAMKEVTFYVAASTRYGLVRKTIFLSAKEPVDVVSFERGDSAERFAVPTGGQFELDVPATSELGLDVTYSLTGSVPSWISLDGTKVVGTAPASAQREVTFYVAAATKYGVKRKTIFLSVKAQ